MHKRATAVIGALVLGLGVAGCDTDSSGSSGSGGSGDSGLERASERLAHSMGVPDRLAQPCIDKAASFNNAHELEACLLRQVGG